MPKKTKKQTELEALRLSKRKAYCLTLGPATTTMLENDMRKEGWDSAAAYIRFRLFGYDPESEYRKRILTGDREFIAEAMRNELVHLNGQLSYILEKFERNFEEFERHSEDVPDTRKAAKWVSLMKSFKDDVDNRTNTIMEHCLTILSALKINTDGITGKGLEGVPQSVLDRYVRNWDDSSSPEIIEAGRRLVHGTASKK